MSRRAPVSVRDLVRQATVLLAGEDENTEPREAAIYKNCKKRGDNNHKGGDPSSAIDFVDNINMISTPNVLFIMVFGASSIFIYGGFP